MLGNLIQGQPTKLKDINQWQFPPTGFRREVIKTQSKRWNGGYKDQKDKFYGQLIITPVSKDLAKNFLNPSVFNLNSPYCNI